MKSQFGIIFCELLNDSEGLCQFIFDPTSMNDPMLGSFFQSSRDLCFSVNEKRLKLLKQKHQNLQSSQPVVWVDRDKTNFLSHYCKPDN